LEDVAGAGEQEAGESQVPQLVLQVYMNKAKENRPIRVIFQVREIVRNLKIVTVTEGNLSIYSSLRHPSTMTPPLTDPPSGFSDFCLAYLPALRQKLAIKEADLLLLEDDHTP